MIKPALTAEEWKALACKEGWIERDEVCIDGMGFLQNPHALAALCLHNQPFGFTWEMVTLIREFADAQEYLTTLELGPKARKLIPDAIRDVDCLHKIADRIQALLPPQDQ